MAASWNERALTPFGVEITGARLDQPLNPDDSARLVALYRKHKLLVFRGQSLAEDQQARIMALLGPVLGATGEYRRLSSDGNLGDGPLDWHSDLAFTDKPFEAISLHALEVNDGQSWTAFANGVDVAADLPDDLRAAIAGRSARTVISMTQTHRAVTYDVPDFLPQTVRPLVIAHPYTGEEVLYINHMQTARVEGLPKPESDALLAALFERLYAPGAVYRHFWRNGDLVVWDNIATQHSRCDLKGMYPRKLQRICCAEKSFFELLPQFSLDDPRIAAWGQGNTLNISEDA